MWWAETQDCDSKWTSPAELEMLHVATSTEKPETIFLCYIR